MLSGVAAAAPDAPVAAADVKPPPAAKSRSQTATVSVTFAGDRRKET